VASGRYYAHLDQRSSCFEKGFSLASGEFNA